MIERDLAALSLLASVAQRRTALGQGLRTGQVLDQLAKLDSELDFDREADAMEEMAFLSATGPRSHSPCVWRTLHQPAACARALRRVHALGPCDRHIGQERPNTLAQTLLRVLLDQVLRIGYFHADPHPGNVFVFADGSLGLIDFGAVGRLDPIEQSAITDILAAVARRGMPPSSGMVWNGLPTWARPSHPEHLERALARLMARSIRPQPGPSSQPCCRT